MNFHKRILNRLAAAGLGLLVATASAPARAATPGWLIATGSEAVRAGDNIEIEVVRPEATRPWPATLRLRLLRPEREAAYVELHAAALDAGALRQTYRGKLPGDALATSKTDTPAMLRAELADEASNRLLLVVVGPHPAVRDDAIQRMASTAPDNPAGVPLTTAGGGLRFDPLPENEAALSADEPMYFVVGGRDGLDARFQLSFKYRLFDPRSLPARLFAPLGQMYFGYTQTSLWDLSGNSKPFRDTSYRPSLFWQGRIGENGGTAPAFLRGGYAHESNGKDGDKSRSIDMLFLQPAWRNDFADGRTLFLAPRFYTYLDREDNPDIARYRGYADWILRYGDENGWLMSAKLRRGTSGKGSGQIDLSYPLREPLFSRVGGFLHFQVFTGYGETLLDYNVKRPPQFRIGFSIAR